MPMNDRELDRIFAAIREETAHPTADLKARMMADARSMARTTAVVVQARRQFALGWLDRIADALGGWMSVGGLTACLALGITFGAAPEGLRTFLPAAGDEPISLSLSLGDTLFAELPQ